jgi:hypothetical protein
MGQRHQIYLRLPKVDYGGTNPNNRPEVTCGMHNQWLYGYSAMSSLYRFLKFASKVKDDQFNPLGKVNPNECQAILNNIYSVDIETGYHSNNSLFPIDRKDTDFEETCSDPRLGDNNNGITIIDVADLKNISYCFMSIGHLECLDKSKVNREESDSPSYANFAPISVEEWMALHFGDEYRLYYIYDRVDFIKKNFKVITTERLIEIFPKMKAALIQGAKDKEMLRPNSIRLIEAISTVSNAVKKNKPAKGRVTL